MLTGSQGHPLEIRVEGIPQEDNSRASFAVKEAKNDLLTRSEKYLLSHLAARDREEGSACVEERTTYKKHGEEIEKQSQILGSAGSTKNR